MQLLDPIDALLQLFDNPTLEQQALLEFEQDMQPLVNILGEIIDKYIDAVTNRNQAKTIIACIVLRSQIGWLLSHPSTYAGRGQ
jgi:hypothetical protein